MDHAYAGNWHQVVSKFCSTSSLISKAVHDEAVEGDIKIQITSFI